MHPLQHSRSALQPTMRTSESHPQTRELLSVSRGTHRRTAPDRRTYVIVALIG
jgi:hypothetical protein